MKTNNLFNVNGKVAIVTGASKGLGKAIAKSLTEAGATVIGASPSTADTLSNDPWLQITTDVSDPTSIENLIREVMDKFGQIDILVNNAGIDEGSYAMETTLESWDRVFNINLRGMFILCKGVGRIMQNQKHGKIINIASVLGLIGYPQAISYTATKGGIIQLTRTLALEWAKYNIQVNCIAPGFFKTDMVKGIMNDPGLWRFSNDKVPRGTVAEPEEIAGTVIYLASKASSYVNGSVIVVDGGELASGGYVEGIMDYYKQHEEK